MSDQNQETTAALARFVRDTGVRVALLLEADGRVIAQHGFTRRVDVTTASTLAGSRLTSPMKSATSRLAGRA